MLLVLLLAAPVLAAPVKNVLVIYSSNRLVRANIEVARGLHESLVDAAKPEIQIFDEFLDQSSFSGPVYETTMLTFLRDKYTHHPPDVMVVAGPLALEFLLHHRGQLFPGVPAVHVGVDESILERHLPLPGDVVGVPAVYDAKGSIALALRLHPQAKRLVVVTGASRRDRQWEADARAALAGMDALPPVEFFAGLPVDVLVQKLRGLTEHDVVYTPGYFTDGAGRNFVAFDATKITAAESRAPVYGLFPTFIGTGVVGGSMSDFFEIGRQTGGIARALLAGVPSGQVSLPPRVTARVEIVWRQVRRWGIPANSVPADAVLHFREPTLWEAHRDTALTTLAVIVVQAALIAMLLLERRRRRVTASALEESERRMSLAARAAGLTVWIWDAARDRIPPNVNARLRTGRWWSPRSASTESCRQCILRTGSTSIVRCGGPRRHTKNSTSSTGFCSPAATFAGSRRAAAWLPTTRRS